MLNARDAQASAQETADTKQAATDKTQAALDQANKDVKDAQGKVDTINDKLNSINHITLPDNYRKRFSSSDKMEDAYAMNQFKHSKADQAVKVDPYHLTTEQQKELTLWITDLLNPLHDQLGFNRFTVTADSLNFAKTVADNYWDTYDHDETAIKKGEDSVGGTHFSGEALGALGVDSYTFNPNQKEFTLDEIKEAIWNNMMMMLFDDGHSNWGHAALLTGIQNRDFSGDDATSYFGFAITENSYLLFENYSISHVDDSEVFTSPNGEEALRQELATATQDLTAKQGVASDAKTANDQAQSELQDAKNTLNTATQDFTTKQATANKTQQALSDASDKLAKDQEAAQKAQALLDQLNQDLPTKLANLQKAKDNLATKQTVLTEAQNNLAAKQEALKQAQAEAAQASADLASAKQAVSDAKQKLTDLQTKLANLQNADANLDQAKAELAQAQKDLEVAEANLATAQTANDQAQAVLQDKQAKLKAAQDNLDKLKDQEAIEQALKEAEQKAREAQQKQAEKNTYYQVAGKVFNAKGELVSGVTVKDGHVYNQKGELIGTVAKEVATRTAQQAINKRIPQLSDDSNNMSTTGAVLVALGGVLGMFGLTTKRRRN